MRQLTYPVAEILGRPGEYRDFTVEGSLAGEGTPLAHLGEAPVRASMRAESVVEGVLATGTVEAAAQLECARCLASFETDLPLKVCELFLGPGHEPPEGEDAYEIEGREIDLEPMLRDALVLALPLNPLCDEACRGLCARCGANLNEGHCGCVDDDADPRWSALAELRTQLEKSEG